jgi:tetratricopeptide (TPR) repeat protein
MTGTTNTWMKAGAFLAMLFCASGIVLARDAQSGQQGSQPAQQQAPAQQTDKDKQPTPAPLSMDSAPASAEEEAAYKAVTATPDSETTKKIQLAEDFLQKYPQSRYRPTMYQVLVSEYFATQQVAKLLDVGDKEIALNPNDAPVLAVVSQTIVRTFDPKAPDAMKRLEKAEQYSKRAIEVTPTLQKPANLTDDAFTNAKNDTLEMAHGGLGLAYVREGKYAEAIPELEESIKANTHGQPDPVNFYLLGIANSKTSHFAASAAAYNKCAAIQSTLQPTCKSGAEEAKKQSETQLSAPN